MSNTLLGASFGLGRFVRQLVLVSAVVYLQGCSLITGDCAGVGHYGVLVTVVDSRTQLPLTTSPKITLRDGAYTEVITAPSLGNGVYGGASDRSGNVFRHGGGTGISDGRPKRSRGT